MSSSSQTPTDTVTAYRRGRPGRSRTLIAAAVAALLAQPPAMALSLGSLEMASHLGEPLRAEIPLGIGPGERVSPDCIRLSTDATAGARAGQHYEAQLRLLGTAANPRLVINGRTPLNEPIMDLVVTVHCAGAPIMERGYLLMLTPAAVAETRAAQAPAPTQSRPAIAASGQDARPGGASATTATAATNPPAQRSARSSTTAAAALGTGQTYRVAPGDTLSTIAQRVTDRQGTLWSQAEAIFAANPAAFIGGDRNRIRAGVLIDIPTGAATPAMAAGAAGNAINVANRPDTPLARDTAPDAPPRRTLATAGTATISAPISATSALSAADPGSTEAAASAADSASATASAAMAASGTIVAAAAGAQPQPVGPPLPQRASRPDVDAQPATSQVTESSTGNSATGASVLRWLAGLLVGLGFISLAALLAWTALRRRPEDADFDAEATGRATYLASPPSFDPGLQQTGRFKSIEHGLQDPNATDEVRVLEEFAIAAPAAMDLDDLFPAEPGALPEAAVQAAVPAATVNLEATGRFKAAPTPLHTGDTTVEHQFTGFSETQALEQQMAEAMAMLERDYTNRFEAAALEGNPSLDATDTLHNLSAEITRSLEDLRLSAEGGTAHSAATATAADFTEEPTALLPTFQEATPEFPADDLSGEHTALLKHPDKVSNG